ncbi:hypothetical protein L2E82_08004 [Cichorium intybus]|uniref:Uncharacterized protein n=1 Tax=Cichorium intybus TaxID=13427 RepID=A0ACB9G6D8_CICIN|nr:hypothetical protein L2E82_08004 [Cichorium intybus]
MGQSRNFIRVLRRKVCLDERQLQTQTSLNNNNLHGGLVGGGFILPLIQFNPFRKTTEESNPVHGDPFSLSKP